MSSPEWNFRQYMSFIYLPVILIGIIGNMLSFYAYRGKNRKSMVAFLLYSLSLSEIILLVLALPLFSLMWLPIWTQEESAYVISYTAKYLYPICMIAKTCSLYIMVLITVERWVAVCRPLEIQLWSEYTTSSKSMFLIIVFAVLLNLPRFFEYSLEEHEGLPTLRPVLLNVNNWLYFYVYFIGLSIVFDYMLPFIVMFVSNILIILELRRTNMKRSLMTTQQQKEQNTTFMLLVVTGFFGFCHFFSMGLKIAESFAGEFLTVGNYQVEILGEMFNFLIILHTASTFFIYYIFSERFRATIKGLLNSKTVVDRGGTSTPVTYYTEKRSSLHKTLSNNTKYSRISSA